MELFKFISKYFWLVAIVFTGVNCFIFKRRSRKHIKENPELAKGYATLFRGYLFWLNIPWIIMGIGCTLGGIPSVWYYFRPMDGNPFVLAWFGCIFALWILGTFWLFFRGGAEMLAHHPGALEFTYGLRRKAITNPAWIKALWLLALAGGIFGAAFMWVTDIPIPRIR
jgi:hypothetical protein